MSKQSSLLMKEAEEDFGTGKFSMHQKYLWDLMEHSESSTQAQVVSVISMSFVGVSIVGMIVNTLEATQYTVIINCQLLIAIIHIINLFRT